MAVTVTPPMPLSSHAGKCVVRGMCNCSKALDIVLFLKVAKKNSLGKRFN